MPRLSVPNLESDTGPSGQIYAQIKKAIGSAPNTFAAIAAHGPAALKAVLAADTVVAAGTLTKSDQEVIKLSSAPPPAATTASPRTIISPSSPA
jgi:hypothetical protein